MLSQRYWHGVLSRKNVAVELIIFRGRQGSLLLRSGPRGQEIPGSSSHLQLVGKVRMVLSLSKRPAQGIFETLHRPASLYCTVHQRRLAVLRRSQSIFRHTLSPCACPQKPNQLGSLTWETTAKQSSRSEGRRSMSDDSYSSFLDQANQDTGASKASSKSKSTKMSTRSVDTDVPASLQKMEIDYVSEADEPFEPVSLTWDGNKMPSESAHKLSWLPF